jgi:hypothetical protein
MEGSSALETLRADAAATPPHRKDRPPIGRFLVLFAGLLGVALSLAALTPDLHGDGRAAIAAHPLPTPTEVTRNE